MTDDLWYEIFLYLPLHSIFKFRCVSKVWLSILSNPNFMNNWDKLNSSLWVLVYGSYPYKKHRFNSETRTFTLSYPELNSQSICHHQSVSGFSFRFVDKEHGDELSGANIFIIGSSNGLVLCTTGTNHLDQKIYYVCNPLTKKSVILPPAPTIISFVVTGFTCDEDCLSKSLTCTCYKVIIRVPSLSYEPSSFKIDIFSSDLGEWKVYNVSAPPDVGRGFSDYDNLVTHNGVFYWMQKVFNEILVFSVNRNNNHQTECRLINLPDQPAPDEHRHFMDYSERNKYFHQCLGESEGLICYAIINHTERSLSVWVLDKRWHLLHKDIQFYDMLAEMEPLLVGVESTGDLIRGIQVLSINPVDRNVVILSFNNYIWAYNIRTRGYEELSQPSFLGINHSGPHWGHLTFPLRPRPTILPPVSW